MRQKALEKPFPVGHNVVLIEVLELSNQLLVTGAPREHAEKLISLYFDKFKLSVVSVEKRSEGAFVVTFNDHTGKLGSK